jgi:hypothetical protein
MVGGYLKLLNPLSAEDRKFAVRAGLIAEEWAHMTAAQHRIMVEELGSEVGAASLPACSADLGLAAYTQAGRWAFGMEFLAHLTDQVGKRFDELDKPLQRTRSSATGSAPTRGSRFARFAAREPTRRRVAAPAQRRRSASAAIKLLQMIQTETDYAVPVADIRTRAR